MIISFNFRSFSNNSLLNAAEAWTNPEQERSILEENDRTAVFLDKLDDAQEDLHASIAHVRRSSTASERLKTLRGEQSDLHRAIQQRLRLIGSHIESTVGLLSEQRRIEALTEARNVLLPPGMNISAMTYSELARHAETVKRRLDRPMRSALKAVPTAAGSLVKIVDACLGAMVKLGALQRERVRLDAEEMPDNGSNQASRIQDARNRLIWVLKLLINVIGDEDLDDATLRRLFAVLNAEAATAARRAANDRSPVDSDDDEDDVDEDDTDSEEESDNSRNEEIVAGGQNKSANDNAGETSKKVRKSA